MVSIVGMKKNRLFRRLAIIKINESEKAQTKLKLAKDKSLVLNISCYSGGYLHISLVCYEHKLYTQVAIFLLKLGKDLQFLMSDGREFQMWAPSNLRFFFILFVPGCGKHSLPELFRTL